MNILYYNKDNKLKIIQDKAVHKDLYYQKARVPTEAQARDYLKSKPESKIQDFFKGKPLDQTIGDIKTTISKVDLYVPLYDEYTKNIYIIPRSQVYDKVVYKYFRFPDSTMLERFKKRRSELKTKLKPEDIKKLEKDIEHLGELKKTTKVHYKELQKKIKLKREYRKLELMVDFLEQFNLETLETTYVKVFYYYANEVGKNITVCQRPSFLPHFTHIKPYYTRSELINMALNMGLIKPSETYYDDKLVAGLCDKVKENDIKSSILLDHQNYIVQNDGIGLVQYYSLQGSFFLNEYLRGFTNYKYKNELLENAIEDMWKLVKNAPEFDKSYTVYRFIKDDEYLSHLKVGDIYEDTSFISTSRDPFYRSDVYAFGFILIKIKIPKGVKGVGLCIETASHFPEEQEIILPPLSKLRLDSKDESVPYYHTDRIFKTQIKTRYEFSLVDSGPVSFVKRPLFNKSDMETVDFLRIEKPDVITVNEKISYFISNFVDPMYQFDTFIGKNKYTLIAEMYDSTSVYKDFYAERTNNGFMIYTIQNGYILFTIELGEDNEGSYMDVNYYFSYSTTPRNPPISDEDFVDFLSKVAYYFEVPTIVIYAEYQLCGFLDFGKEIEKDLGGNYCIDFYNYLKSTSRKYSDMDSVNIRSKFSYYDLDQLKKTDPNTILRKDDQDELYQVYNKTYINLSEKSKHNLSDFYIWLVENNCSYTNLLVEKMHRFYEDISNPFMTDYYHLDGSSYLYNKQLIVDIPLFSSSSKERKMRIGYFIPKNEYRLDYSEVGRRVK